MISRQPAWLDLEQIPEIIELVVLFVSASIVLSLLSLICFATEVGRLYLATVPLAFILSLGLFAVVFTSVVVGVFALRLVGQTGSLTAFPGGLGPPPFPPVLFAAGLPLPVRVPEDGAPGERLGGVLVRGPAFGPGRFPTAGCFGPREDVTPLGMFITGSVGAPPPCLSCPFTISEWCFAVWPLP